MQGRKEKPNDDTEIELPLVKLTKEDVLGALFCTCDQAELYRDALLKFQTWIVNFAEEQVRPLRESGLLSDEEIESIKHKACVISPITLSLYLHWQQMEEFIRMPFSKKEKYLLERLPDRLKARYRGNAASRNAREVSADEEHIEEEETIEEVVTDYERKKRMSFAEFLKEFGAIVRKEQDKNKEEQYGRE